MAALAPMAVQAQGQAAEATDSVGKEIHAAFRTMSEADVMGGVTTVDMVPLYEKSFTTWSLANMDAVVPGYNGELWNQGEALVLVDGVPRAANNILPNEIAEISFMKGAQAIVLYGSRAAKGVILITTKRGENKPLEVKVHGNAGLYVPKAYPKYLGSAEYMTLYNEARKNDGLDPAFTDEDIYHYASGENPFRYPDINFFSKDYVKKNYWQYQGIAEFTGGGKYADFYATVGLYNTDDLMNFGEGKQNHTTRLNVRGNIDLKLNDWVTGWVNTSASFYDARGDRSNFWQESARMRPTIPGSSPLVPLIPISYIEENDENSWAMVKNANFLVGGKYLLGGTQMYPTNAFASMYAGGYSKWTSRNLQFDAGVRINLDKVVKGLSWTTSTGIDYATSYTTSISNEYATFQPVWTNYAGTDMIAEIVKYGSDLHTGVQNISGSYEEQNILFQTQFDYKRTLGGVHHLDANLLAHGWQRSYTGKYHNTTNANLGLRAAYDYDKRYYAEFQGAVVHSSKLAPGHRNGFSPVGTIGWRIGQENFLKDSPVVDDLKVSATYGLINQDIDIENYYMYSEIFTSQADWWGWSDARKGFQAAASRRGSNVDLTFVKRKEFNVNLEASLLKGDVKVTADFFNVDINGLLTQPNTVLPSYFSTYYPNSSFLSWMNYNNQRRRGFDLGLQLGHKFGQVELGLGGTVMYVTSKNLRINENVEYDWLKSEGEIIDAMRGYRCLGFFRDEDEIAASAVINSNTKPGDLKYEDMNDDGIIDYRDAVKIGRWGAPWQMGLNFTAKYKGFTLYAVASGNYGGNMLLDNSYNWVYGDGKYSEAVRNRWTKETAETATYPRLTTQGGELNFVTSDFWMGSSDAFYLDQIQLTYDFPAKMWAGKFVKGLQLYVNGNNLAMVGAHRKYRETSVGTTPQTRVYNFGVKVNF